MTVTVEPPPVEGLDAGVIEEARARQRRYRGIVSAAALAAAGTAAIALAVAGGGGSSGTTGRVATPGGTPVIARSGKSASLSASACVFYPIDRGTPSKSLLAILGVFRRSATPADTPPGVANEITRVMPGLGHEVYVDYLRRARVVNGITFYMAPYRLLGCGRDSQTGEGILFQQGHSISSFDASSLAAAVEDGKVWGIGPRRPRHGTPAWTVSLVVPDGVATVALYYPASSPNAVDGKALSALAITTKVVDNLMVVTAPHGVNRLMTPDTMTWRAANGDVVKSFNRL